MAVEMILRGSKFRPTTPTPNPRLQNGTHRRKTLQSNFTKPFYTPPDDLYMCVKPVIRFGQVLGICPYQNVWSRNDDEIPHFRWKSILAMISLVVEILMGLNTVMNFAGMIRKVMNGQSNPIQIAWALMPPLFYCIGLYTYIHFTFHGNKLCEIYSEWRSAFNQIVYITDYRSTKWKIRFWCCAVLTSAICENIIYHTRLDCYQSNCRHLDIDQSRNHSIMVEIESYYWREHGEIWFQLPFNLLVTGILFTVNKLTVLATNYADVTVMSMAWCLSSKYQGFLENVKQRIEDRSVCWFQVRKDFICLHKLLEKVNEFLSPMIFASYTLLLELISTQLYLGITTDSRRPVMAKVYSVWSFLHLIVRLLLISITSSQITEVSHEMLYLLQKCPPDKYTTEVERLERLVATPIGLTGLGCFRISKPFMLSVIHVIFTCEIIFLQTAPAKYNDGA